MASFQDLFNGWGGGSPGMNGGGDEYPGLMGSRNSMVGLGLGLMSGPSTVAMPLAMKGYEQGAAIDSRSADRRAALRQQQREHELQRQMQRERMGQQQSQWQQDYDLRANPPIKSHIFSKPGAFDDEGNPTTDWFIFQPDKSPQGGTIRKLAPEQAQGLMSAGVPTGGETGSETPQQFSDDGSSNVEDRRGQPPPMTIRKFPDVPGASKKKAGDAYATQRGKTEGENVEKAQHGEKVEGILNNLDAKLQDPKMKEVMGPTSGALATAPRWGSVMGQSVPNVAAMINEHLTPRAYGGSNEAKNKLAQVQSDAQAINTELQSLYLKGQGSVTENERTQIERMLGNITTARDPEAARAQVANLRSIIRIALSRPPGWQPPSGERLYVPGEDNKKSDPLGLR